MKKIIDKLYNTGDLTDEELILLIREKYDEKYLSFKADEIRRKYYSNKIYIRGLIEISNYCKNNCFYCGIRAGNTNAVRYRLSKDDIMKCCRYGYELGFRTFVMQGGEDIKFDDEFMCDVIKSIKALYPDCAVTLSLGERSYESYLAMYESGADRYLLRHETADNIHYNRLHPSDMELSERKRCLFDLKKIGYQTGSGFMVGSPYQTYENIVTDLRFLQELNPHMIGIGPFIPHCDTPLGSFPSGSVEMTVRLISILRLMFPTALIPATTALGTLSTDGQKRGIMAGANVIMPNLSPSDVRNLYSLYNNKAHSGTEAAEGLKKLKASMDSIGYEVTVDKGDSKLI